MMRKRDRDQGAYRARHQLWCVSENAALRQVRKISDVSNDNVEMPGPKSVIEAGQNQTDVPLANALVPASSALPVPLEKPRHRKVRWRLMAILALAALGAGGGALYWHFRPPGLPSGIVWSNGRLEAQEIDIDAKFPERVARLLVDEGDIVQPGQVVALMDTRDVEASLEKAEAQVQQAQRSLDEANADVAQQQTQVVFAQQEFDRTSALVTRGFATYEELDQRQQYSAAITLALVGTALVATLAWLGRSNVSRNILK
jgi:HlyD family secretion protein